MPTELQTINQPTFMSPLLVAVFVAGAILVARWYCRENQHTTLVETIGNIISDAKEKLRPCNKK